LAVIFAGLSVLPMTALRWIMTLASLTALMTAVWITWRTLGHRRSPALLGATLLVTAVALWTEPVQKTLWFGQINLILMAMVVADLGQGDGRRWKGAGIGIATGIKFTPGIFIAYLILTRRFRAAAVAIAVFLLTIAVGFVALPHESGRFWGTGCSWRRAGCARSTGWGTSRCRTCSSGFSAVRTPPGRTGSASRRWSEPSGYGSPPGRAAAAASRPPS
jgi:Glycosyltransferase family 87